MIKNLPLKQPLVSNPENEKIARYVRLTSILRNRILKGEWRPGERIPNTEDLCVEYGMGRNTVRQALALLTSEGLIVSAAGRGTFVNKLPDKLVRDKGLVDAISDPLEMGPDQTIKILKKERVTSLPDELRETGVPFKKYVRIFKLHYYRDKPFGLMDIYVAAQAYDQFPPKADARKKIARLLADKGFKVEMYRQEITVVHPDHDTATLLDYSMAGSLVKISRWRTDPEGFLLTAGTYQYRSDLFVLNIVDGRPTAKIPSRSLVPSVKKST